MVSAALSGAAVTPSRAEGTSTTAHSSTASSPTFAIERYEIAGTPVLDPDRVAEVMRAATGPAVGLPQISQALRRLQEACRSEGHARVSVRLPRQPLTDGVVRVEVVAPDDPTPAALPAYEVRHWVIRGNTALSAEELDRLIGADAGPALSVPAVRSILDRLREAYRRQGYPSAEVRVPRQLLTDGTVIVDVVEGPFSGPSDLARSAANAEALAAVPRQPAARPEPTFEVRRYEVTGNTVLRPEVIEAAFTNAVGPSVTLSRIQEAVGGLQLAYRERGYATVAVGLPPQQLTNATVQVRVTEGVLTDVVVVGNRYFSSNNVVRSLPSLRTNELLNSHAFQRELDLANQNRDRQIYPTLGPGPEPGTSALTLRVKDRLPLHGRIEVNNQATPGTPEWRVNSSLQYNNLWQLEHQLGLSYGFSPEAYKSGDLDPDLLLNRPLVAYAGAYYRLPFGDPEPVVARLGPNSAFGFDEATRQFRLPPAGARPDLTVFASASSIDTGVQTGPTILVSQTPLLTIESQDTGRNLTENRAAGARFNLPLAPLDHRRLALNAGPDWKLFRLESFNTNNFIITTVVTNSQGSQTIVSRVSSPQPARRNEVNYLPLTVGADLSRTDRSGTTSTSLALGYNFLGDSAEFAALAYSRNARAEFGRAFLQVVRDQKLPRDWSLYLRASGQLATGPLIGNEQFSVGGLNSVRGYLEGEEFGDAGWLASVEIRTPYVNARVPVGSDFANVWLRAGFFFDAGQRYLVDAPDGVAPSNELAGTGLGVSANLDNRFDLRVVVGWPLVDTPNKTAGDPRAYFTIGGQF